MSRLLGLTRGFREWAESPREVTRTIPTSESIGESGWLIRFFDSAFFCEWIAVSYLYKHPHSGVRDYLCNRMYTLPLSGIESYLFQICYMLIHKPSPSLDKFVIDVCSKSLKIALKVHWFLMAELEDVDDNEGISRIQEKCQFAATLMGEWPPLIKPQAPSTSFMSLSSGSHSNVSNGSPIGKNQMLTRLLSSKQKLLSLTSSPPNNASVSRSISFSPSSENSTVQDDSRKVLGSPEENNKIFKKFIPGPKVRDALMFRRSVEKEEEESEKDVGFFKRLLRDSRDEDARKSVDKDRDNDVEPEKDDGFFKRLLRDSRDEDLRRKSMDQTKDEDDHEKDGGFFKRLLSSSRDEELRKSMDKDDQESEKEGFFRRLLSSKDEDEEASASTDGFFKRLFRDSKNDSEEKLLSKSLDDNEKEGLFKKFFKDKFEDKKDASDKNDDVERLTKSSEDDDKEGFFKKFFKEKNDDKKITSDWNDEDIKGLVIGEDEENSDISLFRRLFRIHPEDSKTSEANSSHGSNLLESSPGTENFFRKLFKDRDRSLEDSELYGSKKNKLKGPGSPKRQNEKLNDRPPLPSSASQFRKGTYHESLDFVQSLCETSYGLVDVFPVEDRKTALHESLAEINAHIDEAQSSGGICYPMGKGMHRVVHIPEDEAVLLNSREKAPYLICVEVLKSDTPSTLKDVSNSQKISKGGIPLANGDALLPKPPPWAYPLWTGQDMYHSGYDRMSRSTSEAIDQAMTKLWETKVKFVRVNFSVDYQSDHVVHSRNPLSAAAANYGQTKEDGCVFQQKDGCDLEWVRVVLSAEPGVSMDDIVDQDPPRRKEHRRVPSTVAIEEVKAAALKGEAPPGLPLKGAGQDSSDAQPKTGNGGVPKVGDALAGELWEVKKERIRKASVYGKLPGWDLRSAIVKSGDDCRQEHLAVQLISHFYDIFQEAGLPLWLRPYEVLVTSSYTALIETIPDTASLHSIKSRFPNISSLRDFFIAKYEENSPTFKLAQRNFVESMAGYSLVCYLLQAHSASAVLNFSENCTPEILTPYLDVIVHKLLLLLQNPKKMVQEGSLTALASVADYSQEHFQKYYDVVMPYLKAILVNATDKSNRMLRAKAMECISLVGMAVGKEKFRDDAKQVMEVLLSLQGSQMETDDPTTSYMLQAWARLCKCLGQDFLPYMSVVMPPLLQSAQLKPDVTITSADSDDEVDVSDDESMETITLGDKKIGIKTSVLEEKATACNMLCCYADELKEGFYPWVDQVAPTLVPLLKFYFHEEVRKAAVSAMPELLRSAKLAVEKGIAQGRNETYVKQLSDYIIPAMVEALHKEPDTEICASMLDSLNECLQISGTLLDESQVKSIVDELKQVITASSSRKGERAERTKSEDFDAEEGEFLKEENEQEEEVFDQVGEIVGTLIKTFKTSFLPFFDELTSYLMPMWGKDKTAEERRIAICIFDDVAEQCREAALKYYDSYLPFLLEACNDESPDVRQAAVYGIGICAEFGGSMVKPLIGEALSRLNIVIRHPDALQQDNVMAYDNAVSALGKICQFHRDSIDSAQVVPAWLSCLPIKGDLTEAKVVHDQLCSMVERSDGELLGPNNQFLPKIVTVFAEVLCAGKDLATEQTAGRMINLLRQLQHTLPPSVLASTWSSLQPQQQLTLQSILS